MINYTLQEIEREVNNLLSALAHTKKTAEFYADLYADLYVCPAVLKIGSYVISLVSYYKSSSTNPMFVAIDPENTNHILLYIKIGSKDPIKLSESINKPDNILYKSMLLHEMVHIIQIASGQLSKETKNPLSSEINSYIKNKNEFEAVAYQIAYLLNVICGIDAASLYQIDSINSIYEYFIEEELEQLFKGKLKENEPLLQLIYKILI